jgi:hypothetical protein
MCVKCGSLTKFTLHRSKNIAVCTKKEGPPVIEISGKKTDVEKLINDINEIEAQRKCTN